MVKKRGRKKRRTRKAGMYTHWITRGAPYGPTRTRTVRSPQRVTLHFESIGGNRTSIANLKLTSTLSDAIKKVEERTGVMISMVSNGEELLNANDTLQKLQLINNTELTYIIDELIIKSATNTLLPSNNRHSAIAKCIKLGISFYGKIEYKLGGDGDDDGDFIINGYLGFVDNIRQGHVLSPRPHIMIFTFDSPDTHRGGICKSPVLRGFKSKNLFQPIDDPRINYEIKQIPRNYDLYDGEHASLGRQILFDVLEDVQDNDAMRDAVHRAIMPLTEHIPIYMYCDNRMSKNYMNVILKSNIEEI